MRRKFVLPSYEKNKNIREEMKEFVIIGNKFIVGEKEFIRREKEFREKVQTRIEEKREIKEKQKRDKDKKEREEKEEKSIKEEESPTTPPTNIVETKSLKGDFNTLNSSFQLNYDDNSSSQKNLSIVTWEYSSPRFSYQGTFLERVPLQFYF